MSWCHWGSGVLVPAGGFTWSHHSKTQGLAHTGTWCSAGTGAPLRALFVLISHCWESLTVSRVRGPRVLSHVAGSVPWRLNGLCPDHSCATLRFC